MEALQGIEPVHAIAANYEVHPVQVCQWKKEAAERLPEVFARKADHEAEAANNREKKLFEAIGWLKMELERLKRKLARLSVEGRPPSPVPLPSTNELTTNPPSSGGFLRQASSLLSSESAKAS